MTNKVVDHVDGYELRQLQDAEDPSMLSRATLDGYENVVTGVGDYTRDKTFGGQRSGPAFVPRFLTGTMCEDRWRGSDLGGRVVETLSDEMTREWVDIHIQPDDANPEADKKGKPDSPERRAARGDFGEAAALEQGGAPPSHTPGILPDIDDESARIVEQLEDEQRTLGAKHAIREALNYERAFGGGGVLIGVDDGETDLTQPLDLDRVRSIKHLTAYSGGWDGELIAWRYYNDPRHPKFGEPAIYQLRNLGVPIAAPPAPGETTPVPQMPPAGPTGALVFYVHESRLLLFPGTAVSRRARVQMRGWGDSIFMRVDEVLSQYGQTWGGIAILMQEWSQGVLSIEGLAAMLASKDKDAQSRVVQRAQLLQLTQSIARMRLIDSKEKYQREITPMSGVSEVLSQFAMRLAAAANMPVSLLFGQVKGGLGDAGNTDLRFFYDRVKSMQDDRLLPPMRKLTQIQLRAKKGPTQGVEPKRWTVSPRALYQLNEQEQAELRNKQAQTDKIYWEMGGVSSEEVVASRFGQSKYSTDTVLDLEGRQRMARAPRPAPQVAPGGTPPGSGPDAPPSTDKSLESPGDAPPVAACATGGPPAPDARQPGPEGPAPASKEDAGAWAEEKHPRAKNGEFGEGGGGATSASKPEGSGKSGHSGKSAAAAGPGAERKAAVLAKSQPAPDIEHYHGTAMKNLPGILKSGIKPTDNSFGKEAKSVWAAPDSNLAHVYATGAAAAADEDHYAMVVLKSGKDAGLSRYEGSKSAAFSFNTIKPDQIDRIEIYKVGSSGNKPEQTIHRNAKGSFDLPGSESKPEGGSGGKTAAAAPAGGKKTGGELLEKAVKSGGFTFDLVGNAFKTEGYAVSAYPEHERVIAGDIKPADIDKYLADKGGFIRSTPGAHFGMWHDVETGKTYLDVSQVEKTVEKATAVAHAHNQEGIYSLHEGKTIITKAAEERRR